MGAELALSSGGAGVRWRGVSTSWKMVERLFSISRSRSRSRSRSLPSIMPMGLPGLLGEPGATSSGSMCWETRSVKEARLVAGRGSRKGYLACLSVGLPLGGEPKCVVCCTGSPSCAGASGRAPSRPLVVEVAVVTFGADRTLRKPLSMTKGLNSSLVLSRALRSNREVGWGLS